MLHRIRAVREIASTTVAAEHLLAAWAAIELFSPSPRSYSRKPQVFSALWPGYLAFARILGPFVQTPLSGQFQIASIKGGRLSGRKSNRASRRLKKKVLLRQSHQWVQHNTIPHLCILYAINILGIGLCSLCWTWFFSCLIKPNMFVMMRK